ncbi:hypothetical protein SAMN05216464_104379 [Mucilaginibacter pineti]|uniref:Tetratricopeptide repeat-containing protein n=1 Tax=Mucilaginibacter pineti TaxID=1391627 RepID=A0A1G7B595_9SPHI|nr:hypothetical protein [Mucilaginibacter pineti]SDE21405.1 hypothetical protein SAMN05216464_104379 [Mucilaginibacter pineti]
MALIFEEKDRTVVPNWRDFTRTLKLQELANTSPLPPLDISILRPLNDWRSNQNVGIAADLINSAFIAGKTNFPELDEAIKFVLENSPSQSLVSLANTINGIKRNPFENNDEVLGNNIQVNSEDFNDFSFPEDKRVFKLINKTRFRAHQQLNNPIPWVELARLYSFFGHLKKADKAMTVAAQLAPNNRFVLRSATRLWTNIDENEKALHYLKKSNLTKLDPWLTSAHIATSSLMKRYSPLLKNGQNLISSKNFSNFDITELASSIGTYEFNEGAIKKSREFFGLSIQSPNDNSLAQLEWIAKRDSRFEFNLQKFKDVTNPFEAFALEDKENGNWVASFVNVLKWFFDLPYTVRPVLLGSYIASSFLKNQHLAISLCEAGLKANPNDFSIINNLIYAHALDNRLHDCTNYIEIFRRIKIEDLPDDWKVTFLATNGLIEFKEGNIEFGKRLYEKSIEWALRIDNNYLVVMAYVNYAKELISNNCPEQDFIVGQLRDVKIEGANRELSVLTEEVLGLYNRKRIG